MIDNVEVARRISDEMLDYSRRIDESVAFVRDGCSVEEFKAYRLAAGKVLGEIYLEVLIPLYRKHPELKPAGLKV